IAVLDRVVERPSEYPAGSGDTLPEGANGLSPSQGDINRIGRRHGRDRSKRVMVITSGFRPRHVRTCVRMAKVICVLLPRFELTVAAGDRSELLQNPAALAPEPGAVQQVGEVSLAAEAFGVHAGMRVG